MEAMETAPRRGIGRAGWDGRASQHYLGLIVRAPIERAVTEGMSRLEVDRANPIGGVGEGARRCASAKLRSTDPAAYEKRRSGGSAESKMIVSDQFLLGSRARGRAQVSWGIGRRARSESIGEKYVVAASPFSRRTAFWLRECEGGASRGKCGKKMSMYEVQKVVGTVLGPLNRRPKEIKLLLLLLVSVGP